jgi:hypothetical protein
LVQVEIEMTFFNLLNLLFNIIVSELISILIKLIIIFQKERIVFVTANLSIFESVKAWVIRFVPDEHGVFALVISHF